MTAADSFVGEHLNPSPWKEALAERDELLALLRDTHQYLTNDDYSDSAYEAMIARLEAALARGKS